MSKTVILSGTILAALVLAMAGIAYASPGANESGTSSAAVPDAYKGSVEIKDNGWVEYKKQEGPLKNSRVYTKEGKRNPNGSCKFSGKLVLPPGSKAVEERELAFNSSTCQVRVERGTPSADAINDSNMRTSGEATKSGSQKETPPTATSSGEISAACLQTLKGILREPLRGSS